MNSSPSIPSVAHLIAPAPAGGAETVVRALASLRLATGFPTRVVALVGGGGPHPFVTALEEADVPVDVIPSGRRRYLGEARRLAGLLRRHQVTLLHTHGYQADVVGAWAVHLAGGAGPRVLQVATHHGQIGGGGVKGRLYEWLDIRVLRTLPAVVAVSAATASALEGFGVAPGRIHLVRNGLAGGEVLPREMARRELGISQEERVVGWVGRMSPEKGGDLLLDAALLLYPPVTVVMVGDGPERPGLESRVAALTSRGVRVVMAGSRPDAGRLHSAFDVLAISSRLENLPMVLLEAAGAATPTVAFAVGGVPEVIDATTGWCVPAGDVRALARGLNEALAERGEAARRAAAARDRVERGFGPGEWGRRMEEVYRAVCLSAASSSPAPGEAPGRG